MYREIYLDNSATTRPFDSVLDYMDEINRNMYGNPSSLHRKGIEAEKLIRKARQSIASTLGAEEKEIIFTSGGTEANNLAIMGYLEANPRKGKQIITTKIEHPSVLEVYKILENKGYEVKYLDVDRNGHIVLDALKDKVTDQTALISIILVNNEIGSIQPLEEIVKIRNSINPNTAIHIDAVQAYGKLDIRPSSQGIDLVSMSAHKIHGPKGIGALYAGKRVKIKPILFGGGQESLIRSGTENVAGIAGFGLAAELIFAKLKENWSYTETIKKELKVRLSRADYSCRIVSPENSSPYILNAAFPGVKAEVLLHHLEARNIFVSTGSACSSRKHLHSHVLKALKLETCDIEGAVRFSFSAGNTLEEVTETAAALQDIVPKIQIRRGGKK